MSRGIFKKKKQRIWDEVRDTNFEKLINEGEEEKEMESPGLVLGWFQKEEESTGQ